MHIYTVGLIDLQVHIAYGFEVKAVKLSKNLSYRYLFMLPDFFKPLSLLSKC
jgi:hypothetical protein